MHETVTVVPGVPLAHVMIWQVLLGTCGSCGRQLLQKGAICYASFTMHSSPEQINDTATMM